MSKKEERRVFLRLGVLVWLGLLVFLVFSQLPDKSLHLTFCDIGQGDAVLITRGKTQALVDGGPIKSSGKLLKCLKKQMPFWDRKIELMVNTHPEGDHFGGLMEVVKRYQIGTFIYSGFDNKNSRQFEEFKRKILDKKVCSKKVIAGESFRMGDVYFDILSSGTDDKSQPTSNQAYFFDGKPNCLAPTFEATTEDLNASSIVLHLRFDDFDALLTGDISSQIEQLLVWRKKISKVEILKIAHHGSKSSTSKELLESADPNLAVICVGDNSFGHPAAEVLKRLEDNQVNYLRTDTSGSVEIVSNGKGWGVKK